MKWHNVEHNSEEWFELRAGKLTGSSFSKIMANYGKAFGSPAHSVAKKIAVERLSGRPSQSGYSNGHMERGHEQEPVAKQKYEEITFCKLKGGGFFDHGKIGVSPDGLIDDNGVSEIKSVIANIHTDNVLRGSYDPAYKWQFIGNLHYSEMEYMDFISYCADYPKDKQIYICTIRREDVLDEIEMMEKRFEEFFKLVDEYQEKILNAQYEVTYAKG